MYSVKEIFYTLQGEGANSGRSAVFLRFSGCNLWSGKEEHRKHGCSAWCDTDFVGTDGVNGGKFESSEELAKKVNEVWGSKDSNFRFVVITGGEPLLQLDDKLICSLKNLNFKIALETNGTMIIPSGIDWVCVSPKAGSKIIICSGNELKLVIPQKGIDPKQFESMKFKYFFIQPKDDLEKKQNLLLAIKYCQENPIWRLSLQSHKYIGIM